MHDICLVCLGRCWVLLDLGISTNITAFVTSLPQSGRYCHEQLLKMYSPDRTVSVMSSFPSIPWASFPSPHPRIDLTPAIPPTSGLARTTTLVAFYFLDQQLGALLSSVGSPNTRRRAIAQGDKATMLALQVKPKDVTHGIVWWVCRDGNWPLRDGLMKAGVCFADMSW